MSRLGRAQVRLAGIGQRAALVGRVGARALVGKAVGAGSTPLVSDMLFATAANAEDDVQKIKDWRPK